jgi:uncharacterized tellurite resistance protein B-like protein
MPQQDLYVGLGNLAYAVAKADGHIHQQEEEALQDILRNQSHGEIALFAFKLKDKINAKPEEAYQFALRRFASNTKEFSRRQKENFFHILLQVAKASQGMSAVEGGLLNRIRIDMGRLSMFPRIAS